MDKPNGETRFLTHLIYWIAIFGALIGPFFLHERRIACMATDIAVIKIQLCNVEKVLGIRSAQEEYLNGYERQ